MRRVDLLCVAWLVAGCPGGQSDIDTDDPLERPDITGTYALGPILDPVGCEGVIAPDALGAELVVSGPPTALVFGFGALGALDGSIAASFTFDASGTLALAEHELDAEVSGLAFLGDSGWNLDGDLVADARDSTSGELTCTLAGRLEAQQDSP